MSLTEANVHSPIKLGAILKTQRSHLSFALRDIAIIHRLILSDPRR